MPSCLRPMHALGKGGRPGIRESRMRIELAPRHAPVRAQRVLALARWSSEFNGQVPSEKLHPLLKDLSLYWSDAVTDENAGRVPATCQSIRQSRAIRDLLHVWHDNSLECTRPIHSGHGDTSTPPR